MMDFDEYQQETLRTGAHLERWDWLANAALGLAGEAGEVADLIKKHFYHGHDLDHDKLKGELGDVLWYVAWFAKAVDLPLSEVVRGSAGRRGLPFVQRPHKEMLIRGAMRLPACAAMLGHDVPNELFFDEPLEVHWVKERLSFVMVWIEYLADALGFTLEEVAEANIAKLKFRYPDGFSEQRSRDRGEGLLGDAQAVGATKASMAKVETPEVVEVDGISWVKRSGEWGAGGLYQSLWIALDIEGVKLHRIGPLWVLSSPQLFYGVFDATSVPTMDLPHKAFRWAAFRLGPRDGEGGAASVTIDATFAGRGELPERYRDCSRRRDGQGEGGGR